MKKFFTNPWVITFGIIIAGIIIIGVKQGWWKGSTRSYCQCTHTAGQCGRDQYCDGCNCQNESNRIIAVPINPVIRPTPNPPPPPKPIPAS